MITLEFFKLYFYLDFLQVLFYCTARFPAIFPSSLKKPISYNISPSLLQTSSVGWLLFAEIYCHCTHQQRRFLFYGTGDKEGGNIATTCRKEAAREKVKSEGQQVEPEGQQVELEGQQVELEGQQVELEGQQVELEEQQVELDGQEVYQKEKRQQEEIKGAQVEPERMQSAGAWKKKDIQVEPERKKTARGSRRTKAEKEEKK